MPICLVAKLRCSHDPDHIQRLEAAIRDITEIRRGAFAQFTSHPLFKVLIPLASGGAQFILDFLQKMKL